MQDDLSWPLTTFAESDAELSEAVAFAKSNIQMNGIELNHFTNASGIFIGYVG